jgi:adenine-specific DNA-methyltransferase
METIQEKLSTGEIRFSEDGKRLIRRTYLNEMEGLTPSNLWIDLEKTGHTRSAKYDLKKIFPEVKVTSLFPTPKPFQLVDYILQLATNNNDIILDSYAGSGTTAQAVLNINKQDGGSRKFILVEMEDYAETITSERVKRVIQGYGEGSMKSEGTGGRFDFYELGKPMFLEDGNLNELVGVEKIRQYVYYTETKTPLTETKHKDNKHFLVKNNDTAYYFNYEQDEVTTLDHTFLATMKTKAEQYVIYADNCLLTKDFMTKHHIIFKKIPRDITRF